MNDHPSLLEPLLALGTMALIALMFLIAFDGMLTDLLSGPETVLRPDAIIRTDR